MLYYFLASIFVFLCLFLVLLVLVQKGKGSSGIGGFGGGTQLLFGGSGGQDLFQKATWVLGGIFMFGSLGLGYLRQRAERQSRYEVAPISRRATAPAETKSDITAPQEISKEQESAETPAQS